MLFIPRDYPCRDQHAEHQDLVQKLMHGLATILRMTMFLHIKRVVK